MRQLLTHGIDGVGSRRLRVLLSLVFLLLYGVEFIRLQQERVDCKVQDELVISYSYQGYYFGVQIHVVKGLRERGFSSRNLCPRLFGQLLLLDKIILTMGSLLLLRYLVELVQLVFEAHD